MDEFIQKVVTETFQGGVEALMPYYGSVERWFCEWTEGIDFRIFCAIYSILFIGIAMRLTKKNAWRAKNRELKSFRKRAQESIVTFLFNLPVVKSIVYGKFEKELEKQEKKMIADFEKERDQRKSRCLPMQGMSEENLRKRIREWKEGEEKKWSTGKISGAFYTTEKEHREAVNNFASMYLYHNPLHLDTFKELNRMESQVLKMTGNLLTKTGQVYPGVLTSGGSESLILTIYAHRKFYSNRQKPNIVMPVTAHAAFDKGCFYLNVEARKARLGADFAVDVKHLESLIDSNTIMIVGSVPNYPHGIIDPIEELAKIAKKHKVGMHVDGCLGGFVGTFSKKYADLYSLDRDGVTSVSIDHHKFGLAPKGISSVFYKNKELRHCQYFTTSEWAGGLYGTPSFPGSRSGFATAGAWYSMTQLTKKQYKYNSEQIINATESIAKQLREIEGVEVFGDPHLCVIGFTTHNCSSMLLADYLNHQLGWGVMHIHKPDGIHISLTLANFYNVLNKLAADVRKGIQLLKTQSLKESSTSTLYGAQTKIPTGHMQSEVLKCCLQAYMK